MEPISLTTLAKIFLEETRKIVFIFQSANAATTTATAAMTLAAFTFKLNSEVLPNLVTIGKCK